MVPVASDREILYGSLSLRPPVLIGWDVYLAHRIRFNAKAHASIMNPPSLMERAYRSQQLLRRLQIRSPFGGWLMSYLTYPGEKEAQGITKLRGGQ